MITLAKQFNGFNNRVEPHIIGPTQAQDLDNVNLDSFGIKPINGPGSVLATGIGTLRSLHKYSGQYLMSSESRQYVEYGARLYYAVTGQRPKKSADGVTFYDLGVDAPVSGLTAADSGVAGNPNGTYTYYVTYVHTLGGESMPSPVSVSVSVVSKQVSLTNIPVGPAGTAYRRIYRAGGAAAGKLRVTEIADNVTTTYTDNVADSALGAALTTENYAIPPNLEGITVTAYGTAFGFIGNRLYYSEQGFLDAWPATNYLDFPETIRGVVAFSGSLLVITSAAPYTLLGTNKSTYRIVNVPSQQGCVVRDSVVDMGDAVLYASPDGVCAFTGGSSDVISKAVFSDAFFAGLDLTYAKAVRYNERYVLFHSTGYIEYDARSKQWKKGTVLVNACHYNRTDDTLYVAQVSEVCEWEAGSPVEMSYRTGDWSGDVNTNVKHYRHAAVEHTGDIDVTVYIDGVQRGTTQSFARVNRGVSTFPLPMASWGQRVSVKVAGTGSVTEILVGFTEMGQAYV